MRRIREIAISAAVTPLVLAARASAQPAQEHGNSLYGETPPGPYSGNLTPPPPFDGDVTPPLDSLPFTGFDAAGLFVAGVATVAVGAALRSLGATPAAGQLSPELIEDAVRRVAASASRHTGQHAEVAAPRTPAMVRCTGCGTEFDANAYCVSIGFRGRYHSSECAAVMHERRLGSGHSLAAAVA